LKGLTLLTVDVPELEDLAGAASVVFRMLYELEIEILSVSQASSRRRMTFIINTVDGGCEHLNRRIADELDDIEVHMCCQDEVAVVAAMGDGAANAPSSLARMLAVLARSDVEVLASTEQNSNAAMVVVVPEAAADRAVQAVHDTFIGAAHHNRRSKPRR